MSLSSLLGENSLMIKFRATNSSKYFYNKFYLKIRLYSDENCKNFLSGLDTGKFRLSKDTADIIRYTHKLDNDTPGIENIKSCDVTVIEEPYHDNKVINRIIKNKKLSIFICAIFIALIVGIPLLIKQYYKHHSASTD